MAKQLRISRRLARAKRVKNQTAQGNGRQIAKELVRCLERKDPLVDRVLDTLMQKVFAHKADVAIQVVELLPNCSSHVREGVIRSLGNCFCRISKQEQIAIASVSARDRDVFFDVFCVLMQADESRDDFYDSVVAISCYTVDAVAEVLAHGNLSQQLQAARVLRAMPDDVISRVSSQISDCVKSSTCELKTLSMQLMTRLLPDALVVLAPQLLDYLATTQSMKERDATLRLMDRIFADEVPVELVEAAIICLDCSDSVHLAVEILMRARTRFPRQVVRGLASSVGHVDRVCVLAIINALGRLGPQAIEAERPIAALDVESDVYKLCEVVGTLRRIGSPIADCYLPQLKECILGDNVYTKVNAIRCLRNISQPSVGGTIDLLLGLVSDRDTYVAETSILTLGSIGTPRADDVVERLLAAVNDPRERIGSSIATALGQLAKDSESAVDGLADLLCAGSVVVRRSAVLALGRLGREGISALPRLENSRADSDRFVRRWSLSAIEQIRSA